MAAAAAAAEAVSALALDDKDDDLERRGGDAEVATTATTDSDSGAGFINLSAGQEPTRLESLCMHCGENGITTLFLTRIPHFREVVIMSFECPHCNERNNEIQYGGTVQDKGCRYELHVAEGDTQAMNRQVVKSDTATIRVPELDFEIPSTSQRGLLNTVEGFLAKAAEDLRALQEERRKVEPEVAEKLDAFLERLGQCVSASTPFTLVVDDPAGNSFVENPLAPAADPSLTTHTYTRTPEQNELIGIAAPDSADATAGDAHETLPHGSVGATGAHAAIARSHTKEAAAALSKYSAPEEVMVFPGTCYLCGQPSETRMYATRIPYFKEVIVMANACDSCGYHDSEIKSGSAIEPKGRRHFLKVTNEQDLRRDVIKSDAASVRIPEIELELASGTLGGRVTTVEGLIEAIRDALSKLNTFHLGDSAMGLQKGKFAAFDVELEKLVKLERPWTLILEDALSNSFIAPALEDVSQDTALSYEDYERSQEENEEFGLNDISC